MGFSRQESWSGLPSSRGSSWPRDRTRISYVLHWQVDSLPLAPPEEPQPCLRLILNILVSKTQRCACRHTSPSAGWPAAESFELTVTSSKCWGLEPHPGIQTVKKVRKGGPRGVGVRPERKKVVLKRRWGSHCRSPALRSSVMCSEERASTRHITTKVTSAEWHTEADGPDAGHRSCFWSQANPHI